MTDERRVRFSIVTDDVTRSVELYQGALGLGMRALSNPILMFPLGEAEFEVCHRGATQDLLQYDMADVQVDGILISLRYATESRMNAAAERAIEIGATPIGRVESKSWSLRDFNGVRWFLTLI